MVRAKLKLRAAVLAAAALACASVLLVADWLTDERAEAGERKGSVRGSVVDAKGRPVEGAWVYAFGPRCGQVLYSSGTILAWREIETAKRPVFDDWIIGERHAFARSAADGRFAVTGVPPVPDGFVSVYHPRYLPAHVGPDEWRRTGLDIDVGRIVLREGRIITGSVSDVEGRPIAGASVGVQKVRRRRESDWDVLVLPYRESDWDVLPWTPKREAAVDEEYALCSIRPIRLGHVRSVRTDRKGHYRLPGLEPGLYLMGAWTAEHAPSEHEIELLGPGSALRRDFTLRPGESLAVVVTRTHTREPYPGAHVEVRPPGNPLRVEPVVATSRT
ncbi:MAG: carboxypeptidase-like regulatory domain-containing protein, partial [Planctomycetota bacterium]